MTSINKLHQLCTNDRILIMAFLTVLTVLVQTTQAQAYLLSLGQSQGLYPHQNQYQDSRNAYALAAEIDRDQDTNQLKNHTNRNGRHDYENISQDNDNSTIIFIKNTNPSELSQTAMDVITIVWYVATFLALAAFFLLMACSDRRCADANGNATNNNSNEAPLPPPTPTPSYSEFAPPSYETVMKMQNAANTKVFVIPLGKEESSNSLNVNNNNSNNMTSNNNNCSSNNNVASQTPTTPIAPIAPLVNYYTINELHKLSS